MAEEDPYKLLTHSIQALRKPIRELMGKHDEFVLQNIQAINSTKSLMKFNEVMREDQNKKSASWDAH